MGKTTLGKGNKMRHVSLTLEETSRIILALKTGLRNTKEIDTDSAIERVQWAYDFLNNKPIEGEVFSSVNARTAAYFLDFAEDCRINGSD
jgi:hypothetical protein